MSEQPWQGRSLHIIGIAGAGMSALAVLANGLGATVTGSDKSESRYLKGVREAGIAVTVGSSESSLPQQVDQVVYSTAIPSDDPDRAEARRRSIPDVSRHQLLREICSNYRVIAVAGAHGKTTTTAMCAHAMQAAGEDVSYLVGGILGTTGTNVHCGSSQWLVVEADESDGSFLETCPEIAVVTNVELDIHGRAGYKNLNELEQAFSRFLSLTQTRVVWAPTSLDHLVPAEGQTVRYDVSGVEAAEGISTFELQGEQVSLRQPGIHNAWNAAAALSAVKLAGLDASKAAAAMIDFAGTARRFEHVGSGPNGSAIYDDYAHHPTEVDFTLRAARSMKPRRVVAIFQPHLYSRTKQFYREFGAALAQADLVCVTEVYKARELPEDFPGVGGQLIANEAADAAGTATVLWLPTLQDVEQQLPDLLREGDLCLTVGAGNVDEVGRALVALAG